MAEKVMPNFHLLSAWFDQNPGITIMIGYLPMNSKEIMDSSKESLLKMLTLSGEWAKKNSEKLGQVSSYEVSEIGPILQERIITTYIDQGYEEKDIRYFYIYNTKYEIQIFVSGREEMINKNLNDIDSAVKSLEDNILRFYPNGVKFSGAHKNYYVQTIMQRTLEGSYPHLLVTILAVTNKSLCDDLSKAFQKSLNNPSVCLEGSDYNKENQSTLDELYLPMLNKHPGKYLFVSYKDGGIYDAITIFAEDKSLISKETLQKYMSLLLAGGAQDIKVVYPSN